MSTLQTDPSGTGFYGRSGILATISDMLRASGKNPDVPSVADLAPFDQFHTGGQEATAALLKLADLPRGSRVLDVGGGFGGTARMLAQELDCYVTVLDITPEFIRVGKELTARTQMADRVVFKQGDAVATDLSAESFDVVWMQNVSMNIPDKPRLFNELHRVLRPGGRLVLQEVVAGQVQPIHYPVTWARDATSNFLMRPVEMHTLIEAAGFKTIVWEDATEMLAAARKRSSTGPAAQGGIPPVVPVVFGPNVAPQIAANNARNTKEGRIANIVAVFERE